ncbi:TetR/AcrR family transcriptional regulator [Nonomuraea dietziae]|uniref:TetR/AcrR family transcriptional regulator n=1 Tax=Nonomuraea dietziae TaxID=65515 RepID=UPI0033F097CC
MRCTVEAGRPRIGPQASASCEFLLGLAGGVGTPAVGRRGSIRGKTSVAFDLALFTAQRGAEGLVLDLDSPGSAPMRRLLVEGGRPRSLQQIAAEAGLSSATAYRHFGSLEDALQAYTHQTVLAMKEFAAAQQTHGRDLLKRISAEWVRLARERGPAMVHLRSARGFLERREAGERVIMDTCAYLEPAVASVLGELRLDEKHLAFGVYLWNVMFDPREVLDLHHTLGWPQEEIVDRLLDSYIAALEARQASSERTSSG